MIALFIYRLINNNENLFLDIIFQYLNITINNDIKEKLLNNKSYYNLHITFNEEDINNDFSIINFNDLNFNEQIVSIKTDKKIYYDIILISNGIVEYPDKLQTIQNNYYAYDIKTIERISSCTDYYSRKYHKYYIEPNYLLVETINFFQSLENYDKNQLLFVDNYENNNTELFSNFLHTIFCLSIENELKNIQQNNNLYIVDNLKYQNLIEIEKNNILRYDENIINEIKNKNTDIISNLSKQINIDNTRYTENNLDRLKNIISHQVKFEVKKDMYKLIFDNFVNETHILLLKNTNIIKKFLTENKIKISMIHLSSDYNCEDMINQITKIKDSTIEFIDEEYETRRWMNEIIIDAFIKMKDDIFDCIEMNADIMINNITIVMNNTLENSNLATLYQKKLNKNYYIELNKFKNNIEKYEKIIEENELKIQNNKNLYEELYEILNKPKPAKRTRIIELEDDEPK